MKGKRREKEREGNNGANAVNFFSAFFFFLAWNSYFSPGLLNMTYLFYYYSANFSRDEGILLCKRRVCAGKHM